MTARSFGSILNGGYGQRKERGSASAPTDPVRRYSYDENDPRAKPGRRIGDGSGKHKWALCNALTATLEDLFLRQRRDRYRGPFRIQASYLHIFRTALRFLDPSDGSFVFSYEALAKSAGHSENTVKACIQAVEFHGLLCHVRRSRLKEEQEGQPGWERVTAPNAYFFDCKARMLKTTWHLFWRRLMANLKRLTSTLAARAANVITQCFNSVAKPSPREGKAELAMTIARLGLLVAEQEAAAKEGSTKPGISGASLREGRI